MPTSRSATVTGSPDLAPAARKWRAPMRRRRSVDSIVGSVVTQPRVAPSRHRAVAEPPLARPDAACASIGILDQQTMPSSPSGGTPKSGLGAALWLNLGIIYVVWGSTYFGIAIAIESMPPFLMAAVRFVIAGLLLVAWDVLRHPEARRLPTRRQLLDSLIVGGLLLGVANAFVTFGEMT